MGWLPSGDRPSIVVMDMPSTIDSGVMQERMGLPSTCTVQAPQAATPQPNFVPVSLRCSRRTHSSGVSPSSVTSRRWPLTVNAGMGASLRLLFAQGYAQTTGRSWAFAGSLQPFRQEPQQPRSDKAGLAAGLVDRIAEPVMPGTVHDAGP